MAGSCSAKPGFAPLPNALALPAHLVHPNRLLEALRDELAVVSEQESLAAAQPAHSVRDEHLAGPSLGCDARRQDHRRSEQVAVFFDRLARTGRPNAF